MTLEELQSAIRAGYTRVGGHAIREAAADGLLSGDIWDALLGAAAEVIEEYPADPRGSSCLVYCEVNGHPEHDVVAYPSLQAARQMQLPVVAFMITCYFPGGPKYASRWSADYKRRLP